jgi:hypothetical protein
MSRPEPTVAPGDGVKSTEFIESSIEWAVHHLDEARHRLKAGEIPEFHCAIRKFGACAKALLDTVPEVR